MADSFTGFLSRRKAFVFLIMCLTVHAVNAGLFYYLGITPLIILNVVSTVFYCIIIAFFKNNEDRCVILSYIEIICFSFLSDLFTGAQLYYILYIIGMISVVFYLLPSDRRQIFVFQSIGIVAAVADFIVSRKGFVLFPEYMETVESCRYGLGIFNLILTLLTVLYISNMYGIELNASREKLKYSSNHDMLTGLFNRRFFEHIMERNKCEIENEFAIAIFDIDDFKKVNDTYGHEAGDEVLKTVTHIIEESVKKEYVPVRWGGEEFVLYMPDTKEVEGIAYLEEILEKVRNTWVEFDKNRICVTLTAGMHTGNNICDYVEILRHADESLYYGKRNGKNRVVCYNRIYG